MRVMHGHSAKRFMVFHRMLSARREWSVVSMAIVQVMIDVSVEMFRPVEPGTRPDEHTAREPLRAIVAIWSTVVGRLLIVPIRTNRRRPNFDRNLRGRGMWHGEEEARSYSHETQMFQYFHKVTNR
jgi:hypothetical protein